MQLDSLSDGLPPVFKTSALNQKGITEVSTYILENFQQYSVQDEYVKLKEKNQYFLIKLIKEKYGEYGLSLLPAFNEKLNYFDATIVALSKIEASI